MRGTRTVLFAVCASVTLLSPVAASQGNAANADALFNRGVEDMLAGRYDTACPAIAQSQRQDPRPGTLFTLAECEAKWGKIASAAAHYDEYLLQVSQLPAARRQSHKDREAIAHKQKAALSPDIPLLTLVLPSRAPSGTVVRCDGSLVQDSTLASPQPLDPGDHVISIQVPGGQEKQTPVSLQRGDRKTLELDGGAPAPVSPPAPSSKQPQPSAMTAPVAASQPATSSRRTWAYVAGGVGAAGIVAGSAFGLVALGKKSKASDECEGNACSAAGLDAVDSGRTLGLASTIGFGVGLAGLATAAVLVLTDVRRPKERTGESRQWTPYVSDQARAGAVVGLQGVW